MTTYTIKLLRKEEVANKTMAFYFEKPANFEFKAGQFVDYTLISPSETDEEGNIRTFSLASAPFEPTLMISTRMRDSAFKRVLKKLPIETGVKINAPHGDFVLHKTQTTPAVFLIGGIGITPVRSIIAQATHDKDSKKITLLYSNKVPEDTAFLKDFEFFAKENPNFTFIPVMTKTENGEWTGESGHIDKDMLARHIPDLITPIYYLSGSAKMVVAMRKLLVDLKINEDNIRTEEFSGY